MERMLSEPLQFYLDKLTDYSTAGVNLLHARAILSVLEKLGYTLEKYLLPVERPSLSDLSLSSHTFKSQNLYRQATSLYLI